MSMKLRWSAMANFFRGNGDWPSTTTCAMVIIRRCSSFIAGFCFIFLVPTRPRRRRKEKEEKSSANEIQKKEAREHKIRVFFRLFFSLACHGTAFPPLYFGFQLRRPNQIHTHMKSINQAVTFLFNRQCPDTLMKSTAKICVVLRRNRDELQRHVRKRQKPTGRYFLFVDSGSSWSVLVPVWCHTPWPFFLGSITIMDK